MKPGRSRMVFIKTTAGLCWLILAGLQGGCAALRYETNQNTGQAAAEEAVRNAQYALKNRPDWKIDCSHFVMACFHSPQLTAYLNQRHAHHNLTYDLNAYLTEKKTRRARAADIQPGDVLIFNKTYDINHDGHIDAKDVFTHTGIVESYEKGVLTYIDASEDRNPPRIHRRRFSFYDDKINETVATDPATGRKIHARETFYAAYAVP